MIWTFEVGRNRRVSHAGANIEVHPGGVPLRVSGANRSRHCARYLYSQAHGFGAVATPTLPPGNENALEVTHRDHAAFAPTKVVGRDLNVGKSAPH
jgi:hypothetical protein